MSFNDNMDDCDLGLTQLLRVSSFTRSKQCGSSNLNQQKNPNNYGTTHDQHQSVQTDLQNYGLSLILVVNRDRQWGDFDRSRKLCDGECLPPWYEDVLTSRAKFLRKGSVTTDGMLEPPLQATVLGSTIVSGRQVEGLHDRKCLNATTKSDCFFCFSDDNLTVC